MIESLGAEKIYIIDLKEKAKDIKLYWCVIDQERSDTNKVDGHTLSAYWEQIRCLTSLTTKEMLTARGYRGKKAVDGTENSIPTSGSLKQSYNERLKIWKRFCKQEGTINTLMVTAAYVHSSFVSWLLTLAERLENVLSGNANNMPAYARLSQRPRRGGISRFD